MNTPTLKKDIEFTIKKIDNSTACVWARSAAEALSLFLKRGRFGLGNGWRFTRQPNGWIVAVHSEKRNLERGQFTYKIREANYSRFTTR